MRPARFRVLPGLRLAARRVPGREVRKTVTVIFCDVSGSTALGERLDPESLRDVQSRYFEVVRSALAELNKELERDRGVTIAAPRRLDSPMVGRERQLAQLRQAFDAAVEGAACQLFTLLGPAGVGTSRLVQEFVAGARRRRRVLRGRCLPYGEGITYFPVLEAIKQAAGLANFDLPDVVEAEVCSVLEGDEHQDLVCAASPSCWA